MDLVYFITINLHWWHVYLGTGSATRDADGRDIRRLPPLSANLIRGGRVSQEQGRLQ